MYIDFDFIGLLESYMCMKYLLRISGIGDITPCKEKDVAG